MNIIFVILIVAARLITPTTSSIIDYEEVLKALQKIRDSIPGSIAGMEIISSNTSTAPTLTTTTPGQIFVAPVSATPSSNSGTVFPVILGNRPTYRPPGDPYPYPYPNPNPPYPQPQPQPPSSSQQLQYDLNVLSRRVDRLESLNELWRDNFQTMRERFRRLLFRVNALS